MCLLQAALQCVDAIRTQRVLPMLVAMLSDVAAIVRAEAVTLIAELLGSITILGRPTHVAAVPSPDR